MTGYGVRMQTSGSKSSTGPALAGYTAPDKWLKLTRSGSTFTSYESTDGVNWTQIGVQTVAMTGPVLVGLFDTGHNIGQVSTAAFDNVQVTGVTTPPPPGPLPSPWLDSDVGSPALAGSAGYTNGVFTVTGAGADIWGTNDQFNYVSQPLAGDGNGTIVARLTSVTNTSSKRQGRRHDQAVHHGGLELRADRVRAGRDREGAVRLQRGDRWLHLHVPERVDEAGQPQRQVQRLPVQ